MPATFIALYREGSSPQRSGEECGFCSLCSNEAFFLGCSYGPSTLPHPSPPCDRGKLMLQLQGYSASLGLTGCFSTGKKDIWMVCLLFYIDFDFFSPTWVTQSLHCRNGLCLHLPCRRRPSSNSGAMPVCSLWYLRAQRRAGNTNRVFVQ